MPWRHLLAVVCVGVSKDGPGGAEPGPRTDQGAQASPPPPALPASLAPPRGPGFPFQGGREPGQACTAVQPRPVSPRRPPDAPPGWHRAPLACPVRVAVRGPEPGGRCPHARLRLLRTKARHSLAAACSSEAGTPRLPNFRLRSPSVAGCLWVPRAGAWAHAE